MKVSDLYSCHILPIEKEKRKSRWLCRGEVCSLVPEDQMPEWCWETCFKNLEKDRATWREWISPVYTYGYTQLERAGVLNAEHPPNIKSLNPVLKKHTGWEFIHADGYVESDDFLKVMADKRFYAAEKVRPVEDLDRMMDPDSVHDIQGHAPAFYHPEVQRLCQKIGQVAHGAKEDQIEDLGHLYWYTFESGLYQNKVYGAVQLSNRKDLRRMILEPERIKHFDLEEICREEIPDKTPQNYYYNVDDWREIDRAIEKIMSK